MRNLSNGLMALLNQICSRLISLKRYLVGGRLKLTNGIYLKFNSRYGNVLRLNILGELSPINESFLTPNGWKILPSTEKSSVLESKKLIWIYRHNPSLLIYSDSLDDVITALKQYFNRTPLEEEFFSRTPFAP